MAKKYALLVCVFSFSLYIHQHEEEYFLICFCPHRNLQGETPHYTQGVLANMPVCCALINWSYSAISLWLLHNLVYTILKLTLFKFLKNPQISHNSVAHSIWATNLLHASPPPSIVMLCLCCYIVSSSGV